MHGDLSVPHGAAPCVAAHVKSQSTPRLAVSFVTSAVMDTGAAPIVSDVGGALWNAIIIGFGCVPPPPPALLLQPARPRTAATTVSAPTHFTFKTFAPLRRINLTPVAIGLSC